MGKFVGSCSDQVLQSISQLQLYAGPDIRELHAFVAFPVCKAVRAFEHWVVLCHTGYRRAQAIERASVCFIYSRFFWQNVRNEVC